MNEKIIEFPSAMSEERKRFGFRVEFSIIHDAEGRPVRFPAIVLYEQATGIPAAYPRLERWYIDATMTPLADPTLKKRAYCIRDLMDFLLRETDHTFIHEITPSDLQRFVLAFKEARDGKPRDPSEWDRGIRIVYDFLDCYYQCNKDSLCFGYTPQDLYKPRAASCTARAGSTYKAFAAQPGYTCKVYGASTPQKTVKKYRYIPRDYLPLLLLTAEKYDPMLALPIALQAYGGLREGEVVNVTRGSIETEYGGFGRISHVSVSLKEQAPFASAWTGKTDFGSIKVARKQQIYDAFTEETVKILRDHDSLLDHMGASSDKNAPMFINRHGKPLTVSAYSARMKKLFYDHFLPSLERACMEDGRWAQNAPFIKSYKKEFPGCHAYRHWFTMYLLTVAKLTPEEVATWRGDSSLTSMYDYIHQNRDLISMYQDVVFHVQRSVFERALS